MILRWLISAAVAVLPAQLRERYREEWAADLRDSAEYGIRPHRIAFAALRLSVTTTSPKGHIMQPIGPLALVLRHRRNFKPIAVLAMTLGLALVAGLGLLLLPQ
jgi:hypothetical protein